MRAGGGGGGESGGGGGRGGDDEGGDTGDCDGYNSIIQLTINIETTLHAESFRSYSVK